jgi:hypothetical protein
MVDRVKDARTSQDEAQQVFKDALEQFSSVVEFEGGNLEAKYNKLSKAFTRSEEQAREVRERVDSVESVAKALFKEWKAEIKQYSSAELRKESQRQYDQTNRQYEGLIHTMREAAASMDPVLTAFRDQVLFLKHNLNSRAIAGIKEEAARIESDVNKLIRQMEASIAEADAFIAEMGVLQGQ